METSPQYLGWKLILWLYQILKRKRMTCVHVICTSAVLATANEMILGSSMIGLEYATRGCIWRLQEETCNTQCQLESDISMR